MVNVTSLGSSGDHGQLRGPSPSFGTFFDCSPLSSRNAVRARQSFAHRARLLQWPTLFLRLAGVPGTHTVSASFVHPSLTGAAPFAARWARWAAYSAEVIVISTLVISWARPDKTAREVSDMLVASKRALACAFRFSSGRLGARVRPTAPAAIRVGIV